jgi:hypothetical protein
MEELIIYTATARMKFKTSRAELSKLQRLACLGITRSMRTTLTPAVEVLLTLFPLHLKLKIKA